MVTANGNNVPGAANKSGTEIVIEAAPGKTIKLPLESLQGVLFTQDAGNLIIVPADGGEPILLQDFLTFGATENPPKIELINGEVVEISEITPLVQGYSLADINPEAGEDNSDGGGADFRPYNDGNIGDPIGIADLLPPTELSFSREEIEEIIGENEDLDPISNTPPETPPPPPSPADDGPTAVDDGPTLAVAPVDTHAVFVIDTSGSMSQSELQLMEDALKNLAINLFEKNEQGTAITLIDFDWDANFLGAETYTTLQSVLDALDVVDTLADSGTNYDAALDLTRTIDFVPGYEKAIYFLSDGQPTVGNTQGGIDEFNNWVTNDLTGVKVYAIGIGSDAQNSTYLGQIDNTADDNNIDPPAGDPYHYVDNFEDLSSSIEPNSNWVTGNVIDNDVLRTDPLADIPIESISFKGETFTLAGSPNSTVEGNLLYIATDFGLLEMNFKNGEYAFLANKNVTGVEQEEIGYTIVDDDGSTSSAVLTITIMPDHTLLGTSAADDIDGSAIDDIIIGADGDDTLFGGNGADQFYFSSAGSDGNDVIEDFGANGDADIINLSAIFDRLDIASGDRPGHVVFSEEGGNTKITVTDGTNTEIAGFSIVVENASLDNSDITNGKIVVDES